MSAQGEKQPPAKRNIRRDRHVFLTHWQGTPSYLSAKIASRNFDSPQNQRVRMRAGRILERGDRYDWKYISISFCISSIVSFCGEHFSAHALPGRKVSLLGLSPPYRPLPGAWIPNPSIILFQIGENLAISDDSQAVSGCRPQSEIGNKNLQSASYWPRGCYRRDLLIVYKARARERDQVQSRLFWFPEEQLCQYIWERKKFRSRFSSITEYMTQNRLCNK